MKGRRWRFVVRDARGRTHRGAVVWAEEPGAAQPEPAPRDEFQITILAQPASVRRAPARTAICVPGVPKLRALRGGEPRRLPSRVEELTLAPDRMAAYAAGRIVMQAPGSCGPADIFPPHATRPRLDRLALALVEASEAEAEAVAPYTALIRHELGLPPGADALRALEARLAPPDPSDRPPSRAPGVRRLAKVLRRLRQGLVPADSLETLAADLRFLRLFESEEPAWSREALDRLLEDVIDQPPKRRVKAKVVPFRPPSEKA